MHTVAIKITPVQPRLKRPPADRVFSKFMNPHSKAMKKSIPRNYRVPMVAHTIRILKALAEADAELSLKDISARAGVGPTSTFRILFTLGSLDYIFKNPTSGTYRLSAKLMELAARSLGSQKLVHLARPFMDQLYARFNETLNLAVFQDGEIIYIEIMESRRAFRMTAEVGSRVPLHSTALGKAIAAFLPEDDLKAKLSQCSWLRLTPHTLMTRAEFQRDLARVQKRGYGLDNEETEIGATCVAAPILDAQNHPVAAISISGPTHRIHAQEKLIVRELKRVAAAVSSAIQAGQKLPPTSA